ncbi:hypothetical protein CsSME_00037288 [Camellia sinensis var. sinensis]
MTDKIILGSPFIYLLYPFTTSSTGITTHVLGQPVTFKFLSPPELLHLNQLKDCSISHQISRLTRHLKFLKEEINHKRIDQQLTNPVLVSQINDFKLKLESTVCSTLPTAFWHRKKHVVTLPYIKNFDERHIPTKSRPIQMNHELLEMIILLLGLLFILLLSNKSNNMSNPFLVLVFPLKIHSKLFKLMPLILVMVAFYFSNLLLNHLNKLFAIILVSGLKHNSIIVLLKKKFYLLFYMSRPKPPSKALFPSSSKPNQLIVPPPLESITPSYSLDMANRYQALGNLCRPDYSTALASDPFAPSQSVSVTPFPANPVRSSKTEYTKSHITNLFYKEPSHPKSQILNDIAKSYFEFPSDQCAPTPAMVKAQQIPTAAISHRSQPSLPPINLGSPSSSGSKPKSKTVQSTHSKSKAKTKASTAPAQPKDQSKSKSKSKATAKPISPPAQPKAKSKVKPKLSRDELLQLARQITDQAEAQSASSSDRSDQSEEGSVSLHSSEESTNQYSGPEFQDAQDPFA